MKRQFFAFLTAGAIVMAGCVVIPDTFTANIDVTIRHIQEQAGEVLDYVSGESDALPGLEPAAPETEPSASAAWLQPAVEFAAPVRVVYAQLKSDSPRVTQIATSMRNRFAEVEAVKRTGAVGENNRGLLEMVKPDAIADPEKRNEAQRIIAADNEDRKALYKEIARINSEENVSVSTVERIYAAERLARAKPGDAVQLPPAGEYFDKFKTTALGKKLGEDARPGEWVTVP